MLLALDPGMRNTLVVLATLAFLPAFAHADTFSSGSASAYNLATLGSAGTSSGPAAGIGQTGKAHKIEFTSITVPTPEPATLALLGAGVLGLAGMIRRKKRAGEVAIAKKQSAPHTPVPHTA